MNENLPNITLREATCDDSSALFEWRNDLQTREMSKDTELIDISSHSEWLSQVIGDFNRILLIAELNGSAIGVTRFDLNKESKDVNVSINLNPEFRGLGLSSPMLMNSINYILARNQWILLLKAEVNIRNQASKRTFARNGFVLDSNNQTSSTFEKYLKEIRGGNPLLNQ